MQDIDFDEIDRAVSSTIGPDPKPSDAPAEDDNSVPVSVTTSRSPDTTPAARRSSGRFMDVVHPSSDMRSASTTERSAPRSEPVRSEPTPAEPEARSTDWPDPLDFHGFKDDEPKADEPKEEPKPEVIESEPDDFSAKPLESPFLSDAKVEKRPLGAFSDAPATETTEELSVPEETPLLEAPDTELLESGIDDEPVESPKVEEAPVEPESTPAPVEEVPENVPTSITQQYKEQPSTSDQPTGAIFDTEAYHQPLVHTPKKKSGVLVVVWIVALILVGAGAGAAVYFFVLPLL